MLNISNKNSVKDEIAKFKPYALSTLSTPRSSRVLARWILGIFLLLFFCLFLPWQQNINGVGKVTALKPEDRPQVIASAIAGRILAWNVQEGQFVHKNDTILVLGEIKDDYFDPELTTRLKEQLVAKNEGIVATKQQIAATERQLGALKNALQLSLQKANNKVKQAKLKVVSDSADTKNEAIQLDLTKKQTDRFEQLYKSKGIISLFDLEKRRQLLQEKSAKYVSTQNKLNISRNELINAKIELNSIQAEYLDKISKAETELNGKLSYLADATGELSKLKNKAANVQIRMDNHAIIAPQDGFIVKVLKAGIGETIKESDAVATIQPDEHSTSVELYVKAMDVPLLSRGRKVRIEFEGWPALQFSGWPSVSVGTFGGIIQVIDMVNSPDGKYRILVVPDPSTDKWPPQLRLGSGAVGWAMLDEVPVWYELWRQLNSFPPSLKAAPDDKTADDKSGSGNAKAAKK